MAAHSEVLIVSADLETQRTFASVASHWGLEPICSSTVKQAKAILARNGIPLVFCEDRLADGSFRDVLGAAKLAKSKLRVVVTSRMDDRNTYLEAIQLGAFNVIPCPCRLADVQRVIFHAMRDDGEKRDTPALRDSYEIKVFYDHFRRLWLRSLFNLREMLRKRFFNERSDQREKGSPSRGSLRPAAEGKGSLSILSERREPCEDCGCLF